MTTTHDTRANSVGPRVFSRVLVGVDGSHESRVAARQAAALTEGELILLFVYDTASALANSTGTFPPAYLDEDLQRESAADAFAAFRRSSASARRPARSSGAARGRN